MSIKTDAVVIRDETTTGANTATRVGTNLVDIADDLVAKQAAIDLNNAKVGVTTEEANPDVVGQAEAEAGTSTAERTWTAERVKQAIAALGGSGSVDDTAYGVSWNGVTGTAPSKNALYDFIESQVFKVDENSNIIPVFWGGTQAEYDIDFPSGHTSEYFIVITDGVVPPTTASDIVNVPSGSLVATNVQDALNEIQTEVDANTAKVGVTAQMVSDITTNNLKVGVTTEEANTIDSEPIGNEAQILQVVSISQANYDLITPVATTLYAING